MDESRKSSCGAFCSLQFLSNSPDAQSDPQWKQVLHHVWSIEELVGSNFQVGQYPKNNGMEAQLIVEYDRTGDILYLGKTPPYPEQESEEIDYGVVARLNPQSGEIENLEILFFSARVANGETLHLSVMAEFHRPEGI